LEKIGFRISTASNGKEALDLILCSDRSEEPVDLMILDNNMPIMSGLELIDELWSRRILLPFIFVTAQDCMELASILVTRGCVGWIEKPCTEQTIIERVIAYFRSQVVAEKKPYQVGEQIKPKLAYGGIGHA
jgi:YesN/AraC family two-component response regulator